MKHFIIILLTCLCFQAYSQITLDKSNAWIPYNYEYKHNVNNPMHDVTNIDPTPSGANVTWDFSNITVPIVEGLIAICIDPAGTPFADSIPNANLCIKNKDSINGPYQYILQEDNKTELLGMGWYEDGNISFTRYESGNTILELPTTYGSSYTDEYSYIMRGIGFPMADTTTQIIEADAYGTVITPFATYTDVLRIKRTANSQTYINMGAGWKKTSSDVLTEYQWFKSGIPETVMSVSEFNNDKHYMVNYKATGNSTALDKNPTAPVLRIFPLPASDFLNVSTNVGQMILLEIYTVNGQKVKEYNVQGNAVQINTSGLDKGFYLLRIKCEDTIFTRKITLG